MLLAIDHNECIYILILFSKNLPWLCAITVSQLFFTQLPLVSRFLTRIQLSWWQLSLIYKQDISVPGHFQQVCVCVRVCVNSEPLCNSITSTEFWWRNSWNRIKQNKTLMGILYEYFKICPQKVWSKNLD